MSQNKNIYCLTPVFNDWESFTILLQEVTKIRQQFTNYNFFIVAVNDGSTEDLSKDFSFIDIPISILNLKINIGHQRAIAVGLQYIYNEVSDYDFVVVMDSDGEDKPQDIKELINKAEQEQEKKIIFAQRKKRQESVFFKTGYFFYKYLFYFLTGQKISFGNFSIIPKKLLSKVVHQNNIWNHYSGGIIQSKIPFDMVQLDRGKRYKGVSKMNFNSLIIHGLSSIAVYFDFLSLRILRYSLYGIGICFVSVLFILYQKLFTDNAIPGWASSLILIISGIILQLFSVTLIVLLLQLSSRKNISAPNPKVYKDFIEEININRIEK
ncbi:glycosyltransferase [Flavobacterium tibetense]|uniref:Glycosyl transferase family 2 n=1 Tax=Flavobacterium tibetense TaxID=2233533 RepID=A0A365P504_9FLAO|nr:glycosyltransferase [Flavobacterium tibetense]RBA29698.1 glycosyl transferase family 2 [Flavobacterium tibetense]